MTLFLKYIDALLPGATTTIASPVNCGEVTITSPLGAHVTGEPQGVTSVCGRSAACAMQYKRTSERTILLFRPSRLTIILARFTRLPMETVAPLALSKLFYCEDQI